MRKALLTCMVLVMILQAAGQTTDQNNSNFGIKFSGFVNCDVFFDTRQTVWARDGQFLLYPENVKPDADGNDINAKGTFNILSIQTRLTGKITGPDIFKAKSSGVIEGEFFGNINPNINTFRLRLAFVRLTWTTTELTLGQNWHPMYVPSCSPEVISLNSGAPFLVFSRNPQVRIAQDFGKFKISLAAISQVDNTSTGPDGPNAKYLRNSIVPEFDLQVMYSTKNDERKTEFQVGANVDFLMLTPRLATEVVVTPAYDTVVNNLVEHHNAVVLTYKTGAKNTSVTANIFGKLKLPKVTIKFGAVYGGNCYAFNMIGGYAVKGVTDAEKGFVDYANIITSSVWADFRTNGDKWQTGLFCGYSKNLGAMTEITGPIYSRGTDINYLYRIAPRMVLKVSKLRLATELEYTVAAYGKVNEYGRVVDSEPVGNLRILFGVHYYF